MKNNINYINSLPDFLAMQRVSFCWFITQGLKEELALFSRITNFSESTEYLIFGEEYSLIQSPYSLLIARKYNGNYKVQLVIPIEVRDKLINEIKYQNQFPIISLPLMTIDATFIINGCERVIVSQIIRSPGIYFEKNKNQKQKNQFQRKLSADIEKLRSFLPSGDSFFYEFDLFFPIPKLIYDPKKDIEIITPEWKKNEIYHYSINYLKKIKKSSFLGFLQSFKFYRIISRQISIQSKGKFIQIFLKWLKLETNFGEFQNYSQFKQIKMIVEYFNFLSRLIVKYEILELESIQKKTLVDSLENFQESSSTKSLALTFQDHLSFVKKIKTIFLYEKLISNFQNFVQLQINYPFLFLLEMFSNVRFVFPK